MAVIWKIGTSASGSGGALTTAALNVSSLKITLRNHAEDVATWTCEGDDIDSGARFVYGADISIWKVEDGSSSRVFRGVVTSIPREGTGPGQCVSYEAKGGWYFLEKAYYTQAWAVGANNIAQAKTRVILGYGPSGTVTPDQQLADIVRCAALAGAPIGYAFAQVSSVKLPADEQVDLTCADAINRILAWFPDTAVWFEYGGDGLPAMCLQRRASRGSSGTVTLPVSGAAESVTATPRYDLLVPGVQIVFEITSADSSRKFRNVVVQTAGDATALGAAHFTISLDGGHANWLFNSLHSVAVSTADLQDPDWWAAKVPELAGWTDVSFSNCSSLPTVGHKTLDKELVRGAVQPWQDEIAETVTLWAEVSYTSAEGDVYADRRIAVTLTMTDAETGVYGFLQSRQAAEDVPDGLADQVYAAVSHLYYEGRITFVGAAPPYVGAYAGKVINLTGGLYAWESMSSLVQAVEYDVDTGTTTFSFGPPEHLGPQDLCQLAQANRKRAECRSQKLYTSSDLDLADTPTIGGPATLQDSGIAGGRAVTQTFADPNDRHSSSSGTVTIDATSASSPRAKTIVAPNAIKCWPDRDIQNTSSTLTGTSLTFSRGGTPAAFPSNVDVTLVGTDGNDGMGTSALVTRVTSTMGGTLTVWFRDCTIVGGVITHLGQEQSHTFNLRASPSS